MRRAQTQRKSLFAVRRFFSRTDANYIQLRLIINRTTNKIAFQYQLRDQFPLFSNRTVFLVFVRLFAASDFSMETCQLLRFIAVTHSNLLCL